MNYQKITEAVTALFNKEFDEFSTYMPTAVSLAEQTIFNAVPMLACFKTTLDPITIDEMDVGVVDVPSNAGLEIVRSVRAAVVPSGVLGPYKTLEKRPDEVVEMFLEQNAQLPESQRDDAVPKYWYVSERSASGLKIQLGPYGEDDINVEVRGFGLTERLDPEDGTSETWISKFAPDALIYTTAQHMAVFLKYAEQAMMYQEQAQMALMPIAQQEGLQVNTVADKGLPDGEAA